ncbi:MAG: NAD(P)/FAD-dependent oxidoreductase [Candidatus Aenigmarchaeota archaeon]|nr:NAD(P)/FAD-dependent oxidoreductase [Candidatus Aenigmarchaeota archaeon]
MFDAEYDVVVVGAGPAGTAAGKICAEHDLSVLVLEKRQEIGSPKRCGEGLGKNSLGRMGVEFNSKWVTREIIGATCYAPNGRFVRINYDGPEGWVIERKVFDKELAYQASKVGARIVAKAEVTGLVRADDGKVDVSINYAGTPYKTRAKMIIACDGVETKIARIMGLNTTMKLNDIAQGAQLEMSNIKIDPDRIELYFGNDIAPGGYIWIFPKGDDVANVGIGIRHPYGKESMCAMDYLMRFIESRPELKDGSIIEYNTGGVPVGGLLENMVADNLIVAGDAAHHTNPIHGGGIAEAYIGGKLAGEVVVDALLNKDISAKYLSKYNKMWWDLRGSKMKNVEKLRKVAEKLKDEELNFLAEELSGDDLVEFTRGSALKKLATIMMKKPGMIRLAKELL